MDTLPPELLCYILSKLDGYSLGRASQVCCKWRDMVNILSRGFNIWLKCCAEDWDLDSVVSFSQQMCLLTTEGFREAQARKEDWAYWRNMYAEYCRYRLLKKWTLFRRKIDCQDKPRPGVTSVAVDGGGMLVAGDKMGCVHTFSMRETADSAHQEHNADHTSFPCHHKYITDVALVSVDCKKGGRELLIITTSHDGCINISCEEGSLLAQLRPSVKPANRISVFGSYFAVATYSSMVTGLMVYELKRKEGLVAVNIVMKLSGLMYSDLSAVALTHCRAFAADVHGVLYMWEIPTLASHETAGKGASKMKSLPQTVKNGNILEVTEPVLMHQFRGEARQIVSAGKHTIVLLDTGALHILTKEHKIVTVTTENLSLLVNSSVHPLCLALQGPLLAVGCQAGLVLLFDLWSVNWYMDLKRSLIRILRTDSRDIVSVAVTDDGDGTVLVTGGEHLRVFRWRSPYTCTVSSKLESMDLNGFHWQLCQ